MSAIILPAVSKYSYNIAEVIPRRQFECTHTVPRAKIVY